MAIQDLKAPSMPLDRRRGWGSLQSLGLLAWAALDGPGFFDRLSRTRWVEDMAGQLFDALEPAPTDHLIDVGCGAGWHALRASRRTAQVMGLDRSPGMVARAERNRRAQHADNLRFQVGDVMAIPAPDASYDLATGFMLLPVLPQPRAALAEVLRVVRPGGRIGLLIPSASLTLDAARDYGTRHGLKGLDRHALVAWARTGKGYDEAGLGSLLDGPRVQSLRVFPLLDHLALGAVLTRAEN